MFICFHVLKEPTKRLKEVNKSFANFSINLLRQRQKQMKLKCCLKHCLAKSQLSPHF